MSIATMDASASTVMSLTGRRLNRVEGRVNRAGLRNWFGRLAQSLLSVVTVTLLDRMAVKFTDDAIWFKGVSKEAWDDNIDTRDWIGSITPRLEKLKISLQKIRRDMLSINGDHVPPNVCAAKARAVASIADLFEAVESFRWTLLELEANHSPRCEGFAADTPEGIAELFRRIEQDA